MKEQEELQTRDGASLMPVGSRSADGSIQKPGESLSGVKTQEAVFMYRSVLPFEAKAGVRADTKTQIQMVALPIHSRLGSANSFDFLTLGLTLRQDFSM